MASGRVPNTNRTLGRRALFVAVRDAALGQVVRGELEGDAVSGKDSNAVAAQLTGKVREDGALLVELDAEEAAGEFFDDVPVTSMQSSLLIVLRGGRFVPPFY